MDECAMDQCATAEPESLTQVFSGRDVVEVKDIVPEGTPIKETKVPVVAP